MTYEEAVAAHEWRVPEQYNIAADVCDKHPRDKLAMVHEHFDGTGSRGAVGRAPGPRQPGGARAARQRRAARRSRRGRTAADGRDRGDVLRHLEARRAAALDERALRRRGDPPPARRFDADRARDRQRERAAVRPSERARARRRPARRRADRPDLDGHRRRRSGPALLHVRHDRAGEGHHPRPPLHPRPRGVRLLPRGAGVRALPRHGRVGVGRGHLAAAGALAPRARCSASTSARAASTRTSSWTSSAATR